MAKLTRYSSFQELKSVSNTSKIAVIEEDAQLTDFEMFLTRLRNEFSGQKKAKNSHGK